MDWGVQSIVYVWKPVVAPPTGCFESRPYVVVADEERGGK